MSGSCRSSSAFLCVARLPGVGAEYLDEHPQRQYGLDDGQAVAEERVQADVLAQRGAAVQPEHQDGHDARRGGQECHEHAVYKARYVPPVSGVSEQSDCHCQPGASWVSVPSIVARARNTAAISGGTASP